MFLLDVRSPGISTSRFWLGVSSTPNPHTLYSGGEKVKMGITISIQELENRAFSKTFEQSI